MKKQINVRIAKTDAQEQTATGLIYAPLAIDSQGDFMTASDIKAASQRFMKSGRTRAVDVNHSGVAVDAFIAENMISKGDDGFPEGAWVTTVKIDDNQVWKAVRTGELTGFSMLGTGSRNVAKLNGKDAKQITDLDVTAISLVSKAANQEKFSVIKSNDPMAYLAKQMEAIAKHMMQTNDAIVSIQKRQKSLDETLASIPTTVRPIQKNVEPNPNAGRIDYQRRKMARLQEKLEAVWEDSTCALESEEDLRRGIEKCADALNALNYDAPLAGLDSNSAFFQRGGISNFLQGGASSLEDVLGIGHDPRRLSKSEVDAIEVENCLVL